MDERRLEELMREGLQRRAGEADTTAPVVARAVAAGRRRRAGSVAAGLVAASVVAVVVGTAVVGGRDAPPATEPPSQRLDRAPADDGGWRTEYWRDLAVDVPSDWAYGGAPMGSGRARYACYASAMVTAEGDRLEVEDDALPYVGRPIALTDVCQTYPFIGPDAEPPEAPYVWLGASVEPGSEELGEGWVQETVEVNGTTLTVATDDPALRQRILGSATGGETCFSELDVRGRLPGDDVRGETGSATAMVVCAYHRADERGTEAVLTYAAELGRASTSAYLDAMSGAGAPRDRCPAARYAESEWVLLELRDPSGRVVGRHVVHLACAGIDPAAERLSGFETVELTRARVAPWAVGGIPAVVYGPTGGKGAMIDSFIGPQG